MRAFLQKNGKEFNAIFLQPTKYCQHKCVGCYALAHHSTQQLEVLDFVELFGQFYYGKDNYWTNQITISLDKLSKDPTKKKWMWELIDEILFDIRTDKINHKEDEVERPEVHFTVHSLEDLLEYQLDFSAANSIAFSTLKVRDFENDYFDFLKKAGVNIVYNLLAYNKSQVKKDIELAINQVDNIHLVMFKNLNVNEQEAQKHLLTYLDCYKDFEKNPKVTIDRCYNSFLTNKGCSAGCSLMQIWPDGSVSGCPYASKSETPASSTFLGILDNIKNRQFESRESYCHYKWLGEE
jgi:MoaA/NifB/PqqE/SkfB family radical SAM enzyme